jgi:LuxR family maltose regulon positive regulatory protein
VNDQSGTRPGPLLRTKLGIPPPRPNRVPRPRLTERLDRALGAGHKLLLVCAPAGFGKTTLLSDWAQGKADVATHPQVAWVSLDAGDNDLVGLLGYLCGTLQTVAPHLGQAALSAFGAPQPPPVQAVLATLINELAELAAPLVVILDDYHEIEAQAVHDALSFLLDHLPPGVAFILATRADPPLPLARFRARGQLTELRAADLRFTPEEAAAFLNQMMALDLTPGQVEALESRTEGWIAGLQLAALSVEGQGVERTAGFIEAFAGDDRYIADYLVEEVLAAQPEQIQTFLLQTSILTRLCAPLCDALTGSPSQQTLEDLEAANLFVMPLDRKRRWYRYHHLFADLLRHRLQQAYPGRVASLHRRASLWHQEQGSMAEAVRHALAAQDFEAAAHLIQRSAWALLARGEIVTLRAWLDALPPQLVRSRPRLSILYAWRLLAAMHLDAIEPPLRDAEAAARESGDPTVQGEVTVLRATVASIRGENQRAVALAQEALVQLPEDDIFLRGIVTNTLGAAHDWLGNSVEAGQAFAQAADLCREAGNLLIALIAMCNLGRLQENQGHLDQAAGTFRRALDLAAGHEQHPLPVAGLAHVGLGRLLYEWNDLDAADRHLLQGIELGKKIANVEIQVAGYLALATVRQAQGDADGAREAIDSGKRLLAKAQTTAGVATELDAVQVRLWMAQGRWEAAARWAQEAGLGPDDEPLYAHESLYLTLARLLIARGSVDEATRLLARLLQAAEEHGRLGRGIEILILRALALHAGGDAAAALAPLARALAWAEPQGYVRIFLDEGEPLAALLRAVAARGTAPPYVGRLLGALPAPADVPPPTPSPRSILVEPLSEREMEVLQFLAAGLTNREIAQKLFLTVGTVKWHAHNIYGKLGVHSRTRAVARARELNLLH